MYVIKRNGTQAVFNKNKIACAISKANQEVSENNLSDDEISQIADYIESEAFKMPRALGIEEIQDMVEKQLVTHDKYEVAKAYVLYRYKRNENRNNGGLFDRIKAIVNNESEEIKQENSNKNSDVISVQRDYIAGEVSKEIARTNLYPKYIMDANDAGIIHKHDMDYAITKETNCCLDDIENIAENGTVISDVMIDPAHKFSTFCNIATQVIAQIASSQYGGQSVSLYHLVKFVNISRQAIIKQIDEDHIPDEYKNEVLDRRLRKEIADGVQIIQYQIITLMTTNGLIA